MPVVLIMLFLKSRDPTILKTGRTRKNLLTALARCVKCFFVTVCIIVAIPAIGPTSVLGQAKSVSGKSLRALQDQIRTRKTKFRTEMEELALAVESRALTEAAAEIREISLPFEDQTRNVDALPDRVQEPLPKELPPHQRWRETLKKLRVEYAQDLYLLSRKALQAPTLSPSLAFHLVREVAFQDPDHKQARQLLGYELYEQGWETPFAVSKLKKGEVWDPRWGWLPLPWLERYEKGERYYNGNWITKSKEEQVRAEFNRGWVITTEHFEIKTNHSHERGVELGVKLEDFHRFFLREFAAFFTTTEQLNHLFEKGPANANARKHHIYYFRSHDEFNARLREKQPAVEMINGLYIPTDRIAYFFADPTDPAANEETLYHEVTHQLLGETTAKTPEVGKDCNFWVIEGIACYLESFNRDHGRLTAGDPRNVRIRHARERAAQNLPLKQLSGLGMREFQHTELEALRNYYSQGAGLVHFFLNVDDGIYRDEFIQHLIEVYSPNEKIRNKSKLSELTGVTNAELDRQYLEYLKQLPDYSKSQGEPVSRTR